MQSKWLDKDVYKVTEPTGWTSRTSYYGPECEICWPKNPDLWFLLDFSILTNDLAFMHLWKAVETTGFKIKVADVVHLFFHKVLTVSRAAEVTFFFHQTFIGV